MFKILRIFYLSNKSSNNSKNIFIKKQLDKIIAQRLYKYIFGICSISNLIFINIILNKNSVEKEKIIIPPSTG